MKVCIHKTVFGTPENLLFQDGEISWVPTPPEKVFTLGFDLPGDLMHAHSIFPKKINFSPEEKYQKAMKMVSKESKHIPWSLVMPKKAFVKHLQNVLDDLQVILTSDFMEYLSDHFNPNRSLLDNLSNAHVCPAKFLSAVSGTVSNRSVLQTFHPNRSGECKKVNYSLTGTKTGRLTVKSGPQILTIKKDLRSMLTSRFKGGFLKQIDFTSLEPRIALSLIGKNPPQDIYSLVNKEIFSSSVSRQTAKLATICLLYGGGKSRMKEITNRKGYELDNIVRQLDQYFGASIVSEKLSQQLEDTGNITNYYGRPIYVKSDAPSHVLYNNFIQSTAVDVALEGFRRIIERMKSANMKSVPIFVLHDALLIDVNPEEKEEVKKLCEPLETITGFESKFYLDIEEL
tara:strand:+ start:21904 stop:23103 length:1200 start_codon:yes stop_codon:yes gene_type:complete